MTPAPAAPDPWYWSGTFWTIVGIVVAIVLGIAAVVATYRSANPRRRLYVYASNITPLMHEKGRKLGLEITTMGNVLKDPHIITVRIVSRGRRDIRKDAFDGTIKLVFGADVVGVLEATSKTKTAGTPEPNWHAHDQLLEIKPTLLRKDHELTYTVLVAGGEPTFDAVVPVEADVRLGHPGPTGMSGLPPLFIGGAFLGAGWSLAVLGGIRIIAGLAIAVSLVLVVGAAAMQAARTLRRR